MSWASRRQGQYLLGLFLFLGIIAFIVIFPYFNKPPTCSDGIQNGSETGIDCGGSCTRVCNSAAAEPIILWSRAFPVTGSIYNLVAFVSNSNRDAAVEQVAYEFRIYDTNNLLIGRRVGTTFIPPNQEFAIFEPRFDAGQSSVKSVSFDFTSDFVWVKKAPTLNTLPITVTGTTLGGIPGAPTLTAQVNNDSIYTLPSFDVVAILYDASHNAINVSKTHKDSLSSNTSAPLLFTWPQPFASTPVTEDVLVEINPFTTSF